MYTQGRKFGGTFDVRGFDQRLDILGGREVETALAQLIVEAIAVQSASMATSDSEQVCLVLEADGQGQKSPKGPKSRTAWVATAVVTCGALGLLGFWSLLPKKGQVKQEKRRQLNEDDFFTPFDYVSALNPTTTMANPEQGGMIPQMEKGAEFTGATRFVWRNVLIPSECCARCQNDARCRVWVLDTETHECSLKWVEPNATLQKVAKPNFISGRANRP